MSFGVSRHPVVIGEVPLDHLLSRVYMGGPDGTTIALMV
jgi:hypothetical protein